MSNTKNRRLQELDRSDFEIVKDEPDIRGWDVISRTGHKLGAVEELIVDAKLKKIRYMLVDMDDNELKLDHRKVLIPIGLAELHPENDDVLLPTLSLDQICQLSDYDKNNLTPEEERRISSTLGRTAPATAALGANRNLRANLSAVDTLEEDELDPEFYSHEHYSTENLYRNRSQKMPAKNTDYDRGLNLWERRNADNTLEPYTDMDDEKRKEIIRNRRKAYMQTRYRE